MIDFAELPIIRHILPHTGLLDGDDTGFRDVPSSVLDRENPDPLIILNDKLKCYNCGGRDDKDDLHPQIDDLASTPPDRRLLLRAPAVEALIEVNSLLKKYNRELVVVDAFRPVQRQAHSFRRVLERFLGEQIYEDLTVKEKILLGRRTNEAILFAGVKVDKSFDHEVARLMAESTSKKQLESAAIDLKVEPRALANELVMYEANIQKNDLDIDVAGHTAHGNGGAVDVRIIDTSTGLFVNRGVPFSYNNTSCVMDYFEWATIEEYNDEIANNPPLKSYLNSHGIPEITSDIMTAIRRERRILFHAFMSVGASYFSLGRREGECWHFNLGNERGGRQFSELPHGGNASHSLLKNAQDPRTKKITACWTNEMAHELARPLLGSNKF